MFTQEEINKLPKWAQQRINKIQADIEYYKKKASEVAGDKETNTCINNYTDIIPLPNDSPIEFKLNMGTIRCRIKDNGIEIHASSYSGTLAILPQVSNGIAVRLIKY